MVPLPVAVSVTVPLPHLELLAPVGADGTPLTVATTAVLLEIQPVTAFESNT